MITRFFFLLFLVLSLTACGTQTEPSQDTSTLAHHIELATPEYKISIPSNWEKIDNYSEKFQSGMIIGFLESDKGGKFRANVFLRKESAGTAVTSLDYLQEKMALNKASLLGFKLIGDEEILLSNGFGESGTRIFRFQGRTAAENRTLEFMQTAIVEQDTAWILTASYDPNKEESMPDQMATIFKSFTLR